MRNFSTSDMNWFEIHSNVTHLGHYLIEHLGFNAEQIQYYYEKPWKWTEEWEFFLNNGSLERFCCSKEENQAEYDKFENAPKYTACCVCGKDWIGEEE